MFKKLTLAAFLGSITAQQVMVINKTQLESLLNLQLLMIEDRPSVPTVPQVQPSAPVAQKPEGCHDDEVKPTEPVVPPVVQEKLSVMQMYERSLQWADDIVKHVADLDTIMRAADGFITQNTTIFAQHGDGALARAFQYMSQAVVDTKNTLRDVQAYARQIRERLGDAAEYLQMIQIPEGSAPTSDDMEILEMSLDSIKDALAYSGKTTQVIRGEFNKVHQDLNQFGDLIKTMIGSVANNLGGSTAQLEQQIAAGQARIEQLMAADPSCGVSGMDRILGKKSECKKIEETIESYKQTLASNQDKSSEFTGSYPMLQALAGLDTFMQTTGTQAFESSIANFIEQMEGQSILHTLPEPDQLTIQLTSIVEKAVSIESEAEKTSAALQQMFDQTVGRHRFARQLQQLL